MGHNDIVIFLFVQVVVFRVLVNVLQFRSSPLDIKSHHLHWGQNFDVTIKLCCMQFNPHTPCRNWEESKNESFSKNLLKVSIEADEIWSMWFASNDARWLHVFWLNIKIITTWKVKEKQALTQSSLVKKCEVDVKAEQYGCRESKHATYEVPNDHLKFIRWIQLAIPTLKASIA